VTKDQLLDAQEAMKQGEWPKNKAVITLLQCITTISKKVPLSQATRVEMRQNIKGNFVTLVSL
jgi:hypothetical protein